MKPENEGPNNQARPAVSAVVLAGGLSRRLGRDKAVEPLGDAPLIRRVLSRVAEVTDETVVVINDAARASELPLDGDVVTAVDRYPSAGSLGGIFTGLEAARADWALVVACDMPFLNVPLLRRILSLRAGRDAVVPVIEGRPEPTHAAYSKRCLPHIERRLQANDLKISRFFEDVEVEYLPQSSVDELDAEHLSFFNVNTEQDLERARRLAVREL
jgi:molybdopterin-guanine dinucleotide biosynthesis protein A